MTFEFFSLAHLNGQEYSYGMKSFSSSTWLARGALIIGSIVIGFSLATSAQAATFYGADVVTIGSAATTTGDVYGGGGTVSVVGAVAGDVVAGGGTVTVQGPVSQDVIVGGGTVMVLGAVGDDIRVAGGNVTIGGTVAGDVIAMGGTVHILQSATIGGDVVLLGGVMALEGAAAGRVYARGGELTINSAVGGGVDAMVENVTIGSLARITGGVTYTAPQEMTRAEGAQIEGAVAYTPVTERAAEKRDGAGGFFAFFSIMAFIKIIGLTILALIILWLFKHLAVEVSEEALARPALNGLLGFATMIVVPIALVLIMMTILGLFVGITGFVLYMALLLVAGALTMILAGALLSLMISRTMCVNWKWTLLGAVVLYLVALIPFVGWFITFIIYFITLGSFIRVLQGRYQK